MASWRGGPGGTGQYRGWEAPGGMQWNAGQVSDPVNDWTYSTQYSGNIPQGARTFDPNERPDNSFYIDPRTGQRVPRPVQGQLWGNRLGYNPSMFGSSGYNQQPVRGGSGGGQNPTSPGGMGQPTWGGSGGGQNPAMFGGGPGMQGYSGSGYGGGYGGNQYGQNMNSMLNSMYGRR